MADSDLDPESDSQLSPYGEENDAPVVPEEQVSTEDDQFEQARLEAEARDNEPGPTEQTVIDATAVDHGPAYDDDGNLMPGYSVNENGEAVWVAAGYNDATGQTAKTISDDPGVAADHGPAYDDDGNLMPGWSLDEDNNPVWVGGKFVESATVASAKSSRDEAAAKAAGSVTAKASAAKTEDKAPFKQKEDWRVRLSLAPSANYLYRDPALKSTDLLFPLKETDGIVFPYLPVVSTAHKANYDPTELAHSNYKLYFYKNSSVDDVTITADFTAQDTAEANYMLAVIHFLKSATKMFYGQDGKAGPRAGTPPPLCYLSGFGAFQYDAHPLLITSFTYTLPNDVDYIRAGSKESWGGQSTLNPFGTDEKTRTGLGAVVSAISDLRMALGGLRKGAAPPAPKFKSLANTEATYVPTKLSITISAVPVVTRNDISNKFSLHDYATGSLLRGSKRSGGGIW